MTSSPSRPRPRGLAPQKPWVFGVYYINLPFCIAFVSLCSLALYLSLPSTIPDVPYVSPSPQYSAPMTWTVKFKRDGEPIMKTITADDYLEAAYKLHYHSQPDEVISIEQQP